MEQEIETPAVLVDLDVARRNIDRFQRYADAHGLKTRPHVKTHKLPAIATLQLEAGAVGLTCQKISEAEAMIDAEPAIRDILITYNIVGEAKLQRLRALAGRVRLSVVADNTAVVDGLSRAFVGANAPLRVLVECDTGAKRCGVTTPQKAARLAMTIAASPGLCLDGLMTYPPVGGTKAVQAFMAEACEPIKAAGQPVNVISSGGSPDMMSAHLAPVVTEYRPGTYVYNDRSLVARGSCRWEDCALTVRATVISVPASNRAIIDAGSKVLTSDLLGLSGYGHVLGRPEIAIDQLSEEHGRLVCDEAIGLEVGEIVRIVPNHACVVTNMVDTIHVTHAGMDGAVWPVAARGKVI